MEQNYMKKVGEWASSVFDALLSEESRHRIDRFVLIFALASFMVHLVIIYLSKFDLLPWSSSSTLLANPISAVYTPFSFILVYEVYLLIFYLPKSFTTYVAKQYEIITLIIIRRLFKDLAALELTSNWFDIRGDLQFTFDIVTSLVLFYLIFQFQKEGRKRYAHKSNDEEDIDLFINIKRGIAVVLIPLFFAMGTYTFVNWVDDLSLPSGSLPSMVSINNLFFEDFFTVLILVDVVLLLISFFYTSDFHKIIRNSGFVVSTILIRMSFGVTGLINNTLIVVAVLFGLAIILIHNQFEKNASVSSGESKES
jgi:hypothetical protein